jgi:hypothetical protein
VVKADPNEDYAKTALSRGYERLATIHAEMGDVAGALDLNDQCVQMFRDRVAQHPERPNVWHEYADATFRIARRDTDLLLTPATRSAVRAHSASRVSALLDELERTQARWLRERRGSPLAPSAAQIRAERGRLAQPVS